MALVAPAVDEEVAVDMEAFAVAAVAVLAVEGTEEEAVVDDQEEEGTSFYFHQVKELLVVAFVVDVEAAEFLEDNRMVEVAFV